MNEEIKYGINKKYIDNLVNNLIIIKFKAGVATVADLPATGNDKNDARITNDTGHLYIWNGTSWTDQGDVIDLNWSALTGKPSSSVGDIDDAVTKRHEHPITHKLYVDGNRSDTYVEDGSLTYPFKKIQDAIDSTTGATVYNRFEINIAPCEYVEQIVMKQYVHLYGGIDDTVFIHSDIGDVITTSVDANIASIIVSYTGIDSSKVALRVKAGAVLVAKDFTCFSNYIGIDIESGALAIFTNGGSVSGNDSVVVRSGAWFAAFSGFSFSGWGSPYYDLTIEAGTTVEIVSDCTFYNELINNLGNMVLKTTASRIKNDSTVTGNNVKDALETLDSTKYTENTEIKIKVYSQAAEPTLSADQKLAVWIDTDDSNKVYLLFRRGTGDQVSVELA